MTINQIDKWDIIEEKISSNNELNKKKWEAFSSDDIEKIIDATIMYGWDRNAIARYLWIHPASVENHTRDQFVIERKEELKNIFQIVKSKILGKKIVIEKKENIVFEILDKADIQQWELEKSNPLLENQHSLSRNKIEIIKLILPLLNYSMNATKKFTQISYQQIKECIGKWYIQIPEWAYINAPSIEQQNKILYTYYKLLNSSAIVTVAAIAKELNIDLVSISHVLKANNIEINRTEKSDMDKVLMIQAYKMYNKNLTNAARILDVNRFTLGKNWYQFHLGDIETLNLSDKEIYEKFKNFNVTNKDFKEYKIIKKLKRELNIILDYKLQSFTQNKNYQNQSIRKTCSNLNMDSRYVQKILVKYHIFDPQKHWAIYDETWEISLHKIFESYCKDKKMLSVYDKLFSEYNKDPNAKEAQIRKFTKTSDYIDLPSHKPQPDQVISKPKEETKHLPIPQSKKIQENIYSNPGKSIYNLVRKVKEIIGHPENKIYLSREQVIIAFNQIGIPYKYHLLLTEDKFCRQIISDNNGDFWKEKILKLATNIDKIKGNLDNIIALQNYIN